jgi:tetratricopeptide (TPR) repeat protein
MNWWGETMNANSRKHDAKSKTDDIQKAQGTIITAKKFAPLTASIALTAFLLPFVVGCSSGPKEKKTEPVPITKNQCITPEKMNLANVYEAHGDTLVSQGKLPEAIAAYASATAQDTTSARKTEIDNKITNAYVTIYVELGRDQITRALTNGIDNTPEKLVLAGTQFAQAIELNPSLTDSLNAELASAYVKLGKHQITRAFTDGIDETPVKLITAGQRFAKAIELNPSLADSLNAELASAYVGLGKHQITRAFTDGIDETPVKLVKAEALFIKASGLDSSLIDTLKAELADAYVRLGQYKITRTFADGIDETPAKLVIAGLRFAEAIRLNPSLADSLNAELASAYVKLGQYKVTRTFADYVDNTPAKLDDAGVLFAKAMNLNPSLTDSLKTELVDAYLRLGKHFLEQNQFSDANAVFTRAINANSSSVDSVNLKIADVCKEVGNALVKSGDPKGAEKMYDLGLVYAPCGNSGGK